MSVILSRFFRLRWYDVCEIFEKWFNFTYYVTHSPGGSLLKIE